MTPKCLPELCLATVLLYCVSPKLLSASRAPESGSLHRYEYRQVQMGTVFRILLYAPSKAEAEAAASAAFERIEELDGKLSDYRSDSELILVCREAFEKPVVVSEDLFFVLDRAQHFSKASKGAFDITVKPLVKLWRQARETGRLPHSGALRRAREKVGYQWLLLNPMTRSVRFQRGGVELDLGSIGKGYAADEALKTLARHGLRTALIDAGGDLRLGDPPPERKGWTVALESLYVPGAVAKQPFVLHNTAIATSSDQYQFVEIGSVRYSHIVDPRTGLGMRDTRTVTVIAPDATTADALATTLSVLAPDEGMELIERTSGVEAYLVREGHGKRESFVSGNFSLDPPDSPGRN